MKTKNNYVAPSIMERASRIRTSILAGSNCPIEGKNFGEISDARTRVPAPAAANGDINSVLNF